MAENHPSTPDWRTSVGFSTDQLPHTGCTSENFSYSSSDFEAAVDPEIIRDEPDDEPLPEEEGEDLFHDNSLDVNRRMNGHGQYKSMGIDDTVEDERDLDQIMARRDTEIKLDAHDGVHTSCKLPNLLHDEGMLVLVKCGEPATEGETEEAKEITNQQLEDRKASWPKMRRGDSLNLEAGRVSMNGRHGSQVNNWRRTLSLAFQSMGIVYGDIGTSPLYVYASTFPDGIDNTNDVIGVLSLIIYTMALVPLLKYVFIVLWANDNGDGGTFALYSLICRHAKVSLTPNNQPEDMELSNYKLETPSNELKRSQTIKKKLENSKTAKYILFLVTIMGTSMVIGDGVLTPCISVLSAVSGIKTLGTDAVVGISVAILIILFAAQQFGTDKIGITFAPIILVWFMFIGGIGLYNLFKHDIGVLRAFNPKYIIDFFRRHGKKGWISLGGIFLCITGAEAMFSDLGHFSVKAIQVSFSCVTFPALIIAYSGQAAFLRKFPGKVENTFYDSIPDPLYWPTFIVAVAAAIIASQAMISGAFSIISQSLSLGCFPRVKIVHTSDKYEGQVYIPEINYLLMVACVTVTAAFKTTEKIGNAYGIAVVSVMVMTTCLLTLIMLVIWKTSIWLIGLFFVVFFSVEVVYASAVMSKFVHSGYLPLVFSFFLMVIMGIWHYVHHRRYMFELMNKVSSEYMKQLASDPNINRVPGIGLLFSELVQGIPPIFSHFVNNIPSIHSVLVIVSIKPLPFNKVALEERFLFRQLEPSNYRMFRCVARYGYNDRMEDPEAFEKQLVEHLKEFIRHEHFAHAGEITNEAVSTGQSFNAEDSVQQVNQPRVSSGCLLSFNTARSTSNRIVSAPVKGAAEEMQFVQEAMEKGIVYMLGETEVVAEANSSLFKRIVVNHAYSFLRKNFRQGEQIMRIPRTRLLRVGMTYEI